MEKIVCGSGWGIGTNIYNGGQSSYGLPESRNPNNFYPDYECCSTEEVENWEKAKDEYNKANSADT